MKTAVLSLIATAALTAGLVGLAMLRRERAPVAPPVSLHTAAVTRGDLVSTIDATGRVGPEETVDVGAQIGGRIKTLGIDPSDPQRKKTIDFGSTVNEGMVLATIDDTIYRDQVDDAEATLQRSQADLEQAQAKLDQASEEWQRAKSLLPTKAIADSDYDLVVANYKVAKASVASARAAVRQSEAQLRLARTNLGYTVIRSPVQGVVIARLVNVGQTVVASFNAPTLFLIARDLRRMQVLASVNESDIGRIRTNMPVRFKVDTYPGEVFRGTVSQIRLDAVTTGDVVTYTVVVSTDNSDERLLPSLTASLQFEVDQRAGVLLVPNAALRWRPRPEQVPPELRDARTVASAGDDGDEAAGQRLFGEARASGRTGKAKAGKSLRRCENHCRLWVTCGEFVRPLDVELGPTDGFVTEVSGQNVKEGMSVVIGESAGEGDTAGLLSSRATVKGHKS